MTMMTMTQGVGNRSLKKIEAGLKKAQGNDR
jgi:hypothetical protein